MNAVGRPEVLLPALTRFQQDLNMYGLLHQWNKIGWFTLNGMVLPVHVPPELKLAGVQHDIEF